MRFDKNAARPRPDIGLKVIETMHDGPSFGFVGLTLFPVLLVPEMVGTYPVLPIGALHNVPDDKRTANGGYNRGDYEAESGMYKTTDRGLEAVVDHRDAKFYGSLTDAMMIAAALKTKEMMRGIEVRAAALAQDTAKFDNAAAAAKWDVASTPKKDVSNAVKALWLKGVVANQIALPYEVFEALKYNADVQAVVYQLFPDAAKDGKITISHLENYFGLPVAVAGAQKNTKPAGEAVSLAGIWDKTKVWVGRVRKSGASSGSFDYSDPHVGNTFLFNEGQNDAEPFLAEEYEDQALRSSIIRIRGELVTAYTLSQNEDGTAKSETYKRCGYVITTVL